jgi:hypothetical protein
MDMGLIKRYRELPFRAMISMVTRCGRAELGRQSGGLRRSSESPVIEHGPWQFRDFSCILWFLPPHVSEFLCPSDRAAGGPYGHIPISSPFGRPPPPLRPPLGLLPKPHRAKVTGVFHRPPRGGGRAFGIFPEQSQLHRTRTSRPMPEGAAWQHG